MTKHPYYKVNQNMAKIKAKNLIAFPMYYLRLFFEGFIFHPAVSCQKEMIRLLSYSSSSIFTLTHAAGSNSSIFSGHSSRQYESLKK